MISVALATCNGDKYIITQLKSILSQIKIDDEIIISDNFSTDNTIQLIKSLNDRRIKIIYQTPLQKSGNINCIKNFENALNFTKGDYIFLCDQDDIWLDNKVSTCIKYLQEFDIVVADATIVNDKLDVIHQSHFKLINSKVGIISNLRRNGYVGCCMAFNRNVLNAALPFPSKIPMHDMWLGFVAEVLFKPVFIDDKLILHRRHISNTSPTPSISPYKLKTQIWFRINILRYLPLLMIRKFKTNNLAA